ncbi:MAG: ATP-binding cassette domain-containing protein [Spirochaetia bacterium]
MQPIISTKNVTKQFGKNHAVKNLNLEVKKGEIYGLRGKNGAGKSTTIRMLLGLITPTGGKIRLFGEDWTQTHLKRIGSIVEAPGFYNNLSAIENQKIFSPAPLSSTALKEKLELTGLADTGSKAVGNFSMGMRQRLGIARSLLTNPELLILDEPVNGLDPEGIHDIRGLILRLRQQAGITVFLSSHILSEIEQTVDRIDIIHQGELIEELNYAEQK